MLVFDPLCSKPRPHALVHPGRPCLGRVGKSHLIGHPVICSSVNSGAGRPWLRSHTRSPRVAIPVNNSGASAVTACAAAVNARSPDPPASRAMPSSASRRVGSHCGLCLRGLRAGRAAAVRRREPPGSTQPGTIALSGSSPLARHRRPRCRSCGGACMGRGPAASTQPHTEHTQHSRGSGVFAPRRLAAVHPHSRTLLHANEKNTAAYIQAGSESSAATRRSAAASDGLPP